MHDPIKHSSEAAVRRQDKSDSVDQMIVTDVDLDTKHSINDEFGYPLWSHPKDQGNSGNTDGGTQPVDTDSDGDDSDGA